MTPKELRAAAEQLLRLDCECDSYHGHRCEKCKTFTPLARHIIATVREDDGEPVTTEWLIEVVPGEPDFDDDCFMVGNDISICKLGDVAKYGWEVWCHEYELGSVKTRGQFRRLCEGLGIVLGDDECQENERR